MKDYINEVIALAKQHSRFIKYCCIGCSGALLDFIAYLGLINLLGINYIYANAISVTLGITNNFFLNAFLNFKTTDNLFKRFLSFYFVGLLGLLLSSGLLYLLVSMNNVNSTIAKIVTIFVITLIQYSLNKFVTFKN